MGKLGERGGGGWDSSCGQVCVGVGGEVCGEETGETASGGRHGGGQLRPMGGILQAVILIVRWCRPTSHG